MGWDFDDYLSLALRDEVGDLNAEPGRLEAWHVLRAVRRILSGEQFTPFIRCAQDAWGNAVELLQAAIPRL
ncbi:hypothetical protein ACFYXL_33355 [Streptomyces tsukubensis]|uniref:hypothetical protein n=1 Tax=Streptomyces tsukubensis TaxID=83656 RepID=UPI0036AD7E1C